MTTNDRLFIGVYPTGIVYSDRYTSINGDYVRLAFLPFRTLVPEFESRCWGPLQREIEAHMATIQARRGEQFEISTCGQTVRLGGNSTAQ